MTTALIARLQESLISERNEAHAEIAKLKERAEAFEAMNRGLRDLNAGIPQLRKRAEDAERDRDEARAEIERLRAWLRSELAEYKADAALEPTNGR